MTARPGGRDGPALPGRLVLLGHPVAHSLSPAFQNAALAAAGLAIAYEAMDVPPSALAAVLDALVHEGAAGNATVPHKEALFARCARLTPTAARVGAVNTWVAQGGVLSGHNTDVGGFDAAVAPLMEGRRRGGRVVAVVGAGGSAAGVLGAVAGWGDASVRIWSRSPERAAALAARFGDLLPVAVAPSVEACVRGAALVVNATPLGLRDDDAFPVAVERLPEGAALFDLVYRRGETRWVRAARAHGHPAADGLAMLVEQGALSFEWWLGIAPDREAMWAAVGGRPAARLAGAGP